MSLPSRQARLALYANLLRTSRSFASYNFRSYFLRNAREKFRLAAAETDPQRIQSAYEGLVAELQTMRRAAIVNRLFEGPKLVVEQTRMRPGSGGAHMAGPGGAGQHV